MVQLRPSGWIQVANQLGATNCNGDWRENILTLALNTVWILHSLSETDSWALVWCAFNLDSERNQSVKIINYGRNR